MNGQNDRYALIRELIALRRLALVADAGGRVDSSPYAQSFAGEIGARNRISAGNSTSATRSSSKLLGTLPADATSAIRARTDTPLADGCGRSIVSTMQVTCRPSTAPRSERARARMATWPATAPPMTHASASATIRRRTGLASAIVPSAPSSQIEQLPVTTRTPNAYDVTRLRADVRARGHRVTAPSGLHHATDCGVNAKGVSSAKGNICSIGNG